MKIAIIGAGNMGGSIARGLAKGSLIADSDIIVSNPSAGKLEKLKEEFPGISTTLSNTEAATGADIVILAVKPWFVESVMRELKLKSKQTLVSVAAGISFEELAHFVIAPEMPMFRLIPNTAISELESMTLIAARNTNDEPYVRLSRIRLFIIIFTVSKQADINLWHCQWIIFQHFNESFSCITLSVTSSIQHLKQKFSHLLFVV